MSLTGLGESTGGLLAGHVPGKQRPHEGPFVTEHAFAFVPDAVRFDEIRVGAERVRFFDRYDLSLMSG